MDRVRRVPGVHDNTHEHADGYTRVFPSLDDGRTANCSLQEKVPFSTKSKTKALACPWGLGETPPTKKSSKAVPGLERGQIEVLLSHLLGRHLR